MIDLDSLFHEIRRVYFPRWDSTGEWVATWGKEEQTRGNTGYCDSAVKTIFFDRRTILQLPVDSVRAFLIHEICHDTGAAGHNRRWATRMHKAADRAESLGCEEVASIVRSDIFSYAGNGVSIEYSAETVAMFAEDVVRGNPSIDYNELSRCVAKFFGVTCGKLVRDFDYVIRDRL